MKTHGPVGGGFWGGLAGSTAGIFDNVSGIPEARAKGALMGAQTAKAASDADMSTYKLGQLQNPETAARLEEFQKGLGALFSTGQDVNNLASGSKSLQQHGFRQNVLDNMGDPGTDRDKINMLTSVLEGKTYEPFKAVGNTGYALDSATGQIDAGNPGLAALFGKEAAAAVGNPFEVTRNGVPALVQNYKDGSIRPVEGYGPKLRGDDLSIQTNPDGTVNVTRGAKMPKLTEGQSKDLVYLERGEVAFRNMADLDKVLASPVERSAASVPGVGNALVSDNFQKAQQAGREFLSAILRKDTGAAITQSEMDIYGQTYLPQPFDSEAVLKQKSNARRVALDAIRKGLSTVGETATTQADLEAQSGTNEDPRITELKARAANNPALAAKLAEMGY